MKRPITKPLQASNFLWHVELDLIDFRNLTCSCGKNHNWLLHVTDHFSKYSWLFPLSHKTADEVLEAVTQLFWQIGFPKTLHTDNGKEFKNKHMIDFCNEHQIELVHGAPRTPQTQGLVERNNRTLKENLANILKEKQVSLNTWCNHVGEAAYKRNITKHRAVSRTPYELVFGILPHEGRIGTTTSGEECAAMEGDGEQQEEPETECPSMEADEEQEDEHEIECVENAVEREEEEPTRVLEENNPAPKRKAQDNFSKVRKQMKSQTNEKQNKYNEKMKAARPSVKKFEINDYVCVKIDKVDKCNPLHPNVLFGKITEIENTYVRLATKFGLITTLISPSMLTKCWKPNITFDYTKQLTFTAACKMAMEQ